MTFFPTYEARVKAGDPWPGIVEDVGAHDPKRAELLPRRMHLLDGRESVGLVARKP